MLAIDLMKEIAALGGYNITGTDAQSVSNKARALRRVNHVKAYIIGMFGGHWDRNYREGWLPIPAVYNAGTATFTNGSQTVTGQGTSWTTFMKNQQVQINNEAYLIASVLNATTLYLTQPYQGLTSTAVTYQIWQSDFRVYPDALVVDNFLNYVDPAVMSEAWRASVRQSFGFATQNTIPRLWSMVGSIPRTTTYAVGTVTGALNSSILTGSGTSWLSNLEPGWDITITISGTTYIFRIYSVDSDSQVTLYQLLPVAVPSGTSYSAQANYSVNVRFATPSLQRIVNYGYYSRDWPFVNDSDQNWISIDYPEIIILGATWQDFLDKNDTVRAREAHLSFSDAIKDVHTAEHMMYGGVRTIGYNIPAEARDQ